ncbi:MAG: InlB B-repeat-containing protein [Planctomycetota bacterium]
MFNYKSISQLTIVLAAFMIFAMPFSTYASLADKYPGDVGIESDPNVVFVENFEEGSIGAVTARWDSAKNSSLMSLTTDIPLASSGLNSLLITHVQADTDGAHLYTRLLPGYDELYFRFYTKFDTLCNTIHHFVHMGGYNPPTPWPQGGAGIRPDGTDRVSTGIEPHSTWYWDFYAYWMEMRGNPVPDKYWGNDFINDPSFTAPKGQWICVEAMMKMNNPTTERNGELALWVNGEPWYVGAQLASHLGEGFPNGYWLWDSFFPDIGSPPFDGFRWRSTEDLKINWVWLLVYISSLEDPGHINKIWFDDVVVATEYIGPISTTPHYSLTVNSGTGGGYYEEGQIVPISADVITGLTFDQWTGDTAGIANIYSANTSITMPAQDVTITATYTGTQTYLLTVNSGTGDGLYEAGQVTPITADTAPPNEEFSHWAGDTAGIADVNLASTTITMPPQPVTITAMYKPLRNILFTKEFGDATNTDYPGTIEDTWNRSGHDNNYSTALQLNTYTWPVNNIANTIIIKWDLSAIPPDAMVTEATLYLCQNHSAGDTDYENGVHKIINVNPVISTCTWNTYDGTNSWTGGANGGQGDIAAAEDTPDVNSTNNVYKTWSVTNMVQDWVSIPSSNYGMLVNSDAVASSDSCRYYASTEDPDPSKRPKLIVTTLIGDFEPDGDVDWTDFAEFAQHWRQTPCDEVNDWCGGADFNHLDGVNLDDLKALTDNWLAGTEL